MAYTQATNGAPSGFAGGGLAGREPTALGESTSLANGGDGSKGSGGGGGTAGYFFGVYTGLGGKGGNGYARVEFYNPNGVVLKTEFETLKQALIRQNIEVT